MEYIRNGLKQLSAERQAQKLAGSKAKKIPLSGGSYFLTPKQDTIVVYHEGYGLYGLARYAHGEDDIKSLAYPYKAFKMWENVVEVVSDKAIITKPTKPIEPSEALTEESVKMIDGFFGGAFYPFTRLKGKLSLTIDKTFVCNSAGVPRLAFVPTRRELSKITGTDTTTAKGYAEGIGILLNELLDSDQLYEAGEAILRAESVAYLHYMIYEFYRTEDFTRLTDIGARGAEAGLSKYWRGLVEDATGQTPERCALAKYINWELSSRVHWMMQDKRAISEYTGAPLSEIYRSKPLAEPII